uniref:Uncharacterized protein n=1 Tax=Rhizophora mucronata TaxID=61149 RepID=A0A2P2IUB5_RHIMU
MKILIRCCWNLQPPYKGFICVAKLAGYGGSVLDSTTRQNLCICSFIRCQRNA